MKYLAILLILSSMIVCSENSAADDIPEFKLTIKDHQFTPSEFIIPAEVKVKLNVDNQDVTPEEFESHELNREKVIPGNSQARIFVGPLETGVYPFYGEFNQKTAQGKLIAK